MAGAAIDAPVESVAKSSIEGGTPCLHIGVRAEPGAGALQAEQAAEGSVSVDHGEPTSLSGDHLSPGVGQVGVGTDDAPVEATQPHDARTAGRSQIIAIDDVPAIDDGNEASLIDDEGAMDVVVVEERLEFADDRGRSMDDGTGDHRIAHR